MSTLPVATLSYDPSEEIMYVGLANLTLNTRVEISSVFTSIRKFWVSRCNKKKVYGVIDYTNFTLNMEHKDYYADFVKEAVDVYAITVVRHTEDLLARTSLRAVAIKIHRPSNLYATKEEAVEVVRAIRVKRIKLESSPTFRI